MRLTRFVNCDPSWLYCARRVVVFGSYLSRADWVGDIDVAIHLDRRPEFAEYWPEVLLAKADAAANRGRRFRGFLDRLAWPETEIRRYLRGGLRWLSLHDWTKEEPGLQHAPHIVLLEEEASGAAAKSIGQKIAERRTGSRKDHSDARRMKIPLREYLATVLPGLADTSVQRLPELTPAAWAARSR